MLHYCSVEDITSVLTAASRYQDDILKVRDGVTARLNGWIRRRLDWQTGIVEYFDTMALGNHNKMNLWLEKRSIDLNTVAMHWTPHRNWDDTPALDIGTGYILDPEKGRVTLFGPRYTATQGGLRISYSGGFPAILEDNVPTDVMECPHNLRLSAINQCVYDAKKLLGMDQGKSQEEDRGKVVQRIHLSTGILMEVLADFMEYRRPLGQ